MYLVRTELIANAGGAGELEAQVARLGNSRKGTKGYLGQTLLHSYGEPNKYTVTSRWENAEAALAFVAGQAIADYAKGLTPGAFTITGQRGYEGVLEVDGPQGPAASSTCEILVDWTVATGRAAAFESSRKALFEIRQKNAKGFVSARLRRNAGTPNKYLVINIYSDVAAARAANSIPEVVAFNAAHPGSVYASGAPTVDTYHVVHRI